MSMIKKGVYAWNKELTPPNFESREISIAYTITAIFLEDGISYKGVFDRIIIRFTGSGFYLSFHCVAVNPPVSNGWTPSEWLVFYNTTSSYNFIGWNPIFSDGCRFQNITEVFDTFDYFNEELYEAFVEWFNENTKPVSVEITYNNEAIGLSSGESATLHTEGHKLTDDLMVKANGCNHETYGLSYTERMTIGLKRKIDKPTDEQVAEFVDGSLALIPSDVEVFWGKTSFNYIYEELPTGDTLSLLNICIRPLIMFSNHTVTLWYIWEDSINGVKAYLESEGVDSSVIGSEGWYRITENGLEALYDDDFYCGIALENIDVVFPYNDYLYSIFGFYRDGDKAKPIDILGSVSSGIYPNTTFVAETGGKLCDKDIAFVTGRTLGSDVYNEDGTLITDGINRAEPHKDWINFNQVKVDIVGCQNPSFTIYQHYYTLTGSGPYEYPQYLDGNTSNFLYTRGGTYGISVDSNRNHKIVGVYTNATIVTQDDNKVYVSGLPHNTYIVVMVEEI